MEKTKSSAFNFVIADDDSDDHQTLQKLIWEQNTYHKITSVYNGLQLIEYLDRKGMYKHCREPYPDCIFLDLNMPLLNGIDVLKRIRVNKDYNDLMIFVLTTSNCSTQKETLIDLGVNDFFTKSDDNTLHLIVKNVILQLVPKIALQSTKA